MILCLRFYDQYESKDFHPPFIFSEVYNRQVEWLLTMVSAMAAIMASCLRELGAGHSNESIDDFILKPQDLSKYIPQNTMNYAKAIIDFIPVLTLPTALAHSLQHSTTPPTNVALYAAHGQWHKVDKALQADARLVNAEPSTFSLLHMAVFWQDPFAITMLLSHGAHIDAATTRDDMVAKGSTALHIAVTLGNAAILRLLLGHGADAAAVDGRGQAVKVIPMPPECAAALDQAHELVESCQQLYQAAVARDMKSFFQALEAQDLPVDIRPSPKDPLFLIHHVARAGHPLAYQLLLDRGANPLLRSADHRLPSEVARAAGHAGMAAAARETERRFRALTADPPCLPLAPSQAHPATPSYGVGGSDPPPTHRRFPFRRRQSSSGSEDTPSPKPSAAHGRPPHARKPNAASFPPGDPTVAHASSIRRLVNYISGRG